MNVEVLENLNMLKHLQLRFQYEKVNLTMLTAFKILLKNYFNLFNLRVT